MKCEPCMSQHLATLKNFGRNKGRRFKQVLFSHRTNNTTAEKHLYDRKHIHVCSRRFTTLCGGLWSDCIEQFTIFFEGDLADAPDFRIQGISQHRELRPLLFAISVVSLTSPTNQYREDTGDGAYGFSSLSEKTGMSQQRQHILLSYFKTLSVGPVWVLNPNLPHSSPALIHTSLPGGGDS